MQQKDPFTTLLDKQCDDRIRDEARIANDLQRDYPCMTRTEALKLAKKALDQAKARGAY